MQSWPSRRMNPAGRESWAEDKRARRTEAQSHDYRETFITGPVKFIPSCLHLSSLYIIVPPAIEGGLDKLFEPQRMRSCFTNVKQAAQKATFFYIIQTSPAWENRENESLCKRDMQTGERAHLLTQGMAPPSWTADVILSHTGEPSSWWQTAKTGFTSRKKLSSRWRDWGQHLKNLPEMWHCAGIESSGINNLISDVGKKKKKKSEGWSSF